MKRLDHKERMSQTVIITFVLNELLDDVGGILLVNTQGNYLKKLSTTLVKIRTAAKG